MGLFDFFRKKQTTVSEPLPFILMKKYAGHLHLFRRFHAQENHAPIAAYEDSAGEIFGAALIKDNSGEELYVQEALQMLETSLSLKLQEGHAISYTIFYHSNCLAKPGEPITDTNNPVATEHEDLTAISIKYVTVSGNKGVLVSPYTTENGQISYQPISGLDSAQNTAISNLLAEYDNHYRTETENEVIENPAGLKISTVSIDGHNNNWAALVGFQNYYEGEGQEKLNTLFEKFVETIAGIAKDNLAVYTKNYDPIILKALGSSNFMTTFPVIKTAIKLPVKNKEIKESFNKREAYIKGGGKDTFGLIYQATDYVTNKDRYQSGKEQEMHISAIAYVLDIPSDSETYVGYFPNKDLAESGCFDFIGRLLDFHELTLFQDDKYNGYILKTLIVDHPDEPDFFVLDIFVNKTNMRFQQLEKGMRITGMMSLQGEICP
jgi:hypothetical protein